MDLNILFPEKEIEIAGETLVLRPFCFGDIPKIIKAIGNFLNVLIDNAKALETLKFEEKDGENHLKLTPEILTFFTDLIGDGGEDLLFIIALGAKKPLSYINSLPPDEGLKLTIEVFEVNYDFFTKRLKTVWPGLEARIKELMGKNQKDTGKLSQD